MSEVERRVQQQKNDDLIDAVQNQDVEGVKRLLDIRAQIDEAANENGCRALHLACHK